MTTTAKPRKRRRSSYFTERPLTRAHGLTWREDGFPFMQSILTPGEKGDAAISHFTIKEKEAEHFNLMELMSLMSGLTRVSPGKYVRLHIGGKSAGEVMMSDTDMERRTNWDIVNKAHGRVLIAGLGIGLILHPLLRPDRHTQRRNKWDDLKPAVQHVTVIEKNPNVVALVSPSLMRYDGRLSIVQADIFEFDPGKEKFDTVYFDIWPHISQDNLPEIAQLHQRWKTRLHRGDGCTPYMSSWMVEYLRSQRAEDNRNSWRW